MTRQGVHLRLRGTGVAMRPTGRQRSRRTSPATLGREPCAGNTSTIETDASEGLYTIALAGSLNVQSRVAEAFLEQGPVQITFFSSSMENARKQVRALNANGYCCTLVSRVLGRWCRLCHCRVDRPVKRLCDGCEWLATAHGFENAFGLCAADGERSLQRAFGFQVTKRHGNYRGVKISAPGGRAWAPLP